MNLANIEYQDKLRQYVLQMRPVFKPNALFSDETSNYVTPMEPDPGDIVTIRFRTWKDNVDKVYLVSNDRHLAMEYEKSEGDFDYFKIRLVMQEESIHYFFEIHAGKIRCFYNKIGVSRDRLDVYDFTIAPGFHTPEWAKGAVMYQIFVDRFSSGDTNNTVEDCEYYYIGDYTDLHPSIDAENDLLTINYGDSKNSSYRCFVIYKLSEAKKAPMTNVTITCTDGFQTDRPASTNPVSVVVRCHDLTTLTPVARPRFLKTGYGASGATYYDWQGYDVHKNRLYYTEGQSNYNLFGSFYSGSSFAYVTVFDFEGNIVEERTQVAVVSDKDKLTQIGVSVFGSLEAEGIKVCKDKLYLGYTARGITADNTKHYQNIFVFDPSSK
mgnify:FL=1